MATTITQGRKRDAQSYLYSWVGQDKTGKAVRGEMRANGQNVVVAQLRRQGLSYIKVKKQRIGTGRKITEKDIAIFTRQLAVSDADVLVAACESAGLDGAEARAVLVEGRYIDEVRADERFWREQGISAVPAVIINQKYLISGGQPVEAFEKAIRSIAAEG